MDHVANEVFLKAMDDIKKSLGPKISSYVTTKCEEQIQHFDSDKVKEDDEALAWLGYDKHRWKRSKADNMLSDHDNHSAKIRKRRKRGKRKKKPKSLLFEEKGMIGINAFNYETNKITCPFCEETFKRRSPFYKHIRILHNEHIGNTFWLYRMKEDNRSTITIPFL